MSPTHAKLLVRALNENIKKFENQFGEIKLDAGPNIGNFPGFPPGGTFTN
jgi:hypothetical protein